MNKKALSFVLVLALIFTLNTSVFASPSDSTSDELKQTQNTKKNLEAKVSNLDTEINGVLKKIDDNKKNMNKLAAKMKDSQLQLKATENKLKDQQYLLQKRVRAMYMNDNSSYLQILLSSKNFSDFLSNVNTITSVMNYDNNIVSNVQTERKNLLNEKESLNSENQKLMSLKASNESILSNLSSDIKQEKTLLASANEKEKTLIAKQQAEAAAAAAAKAKAAAIAAQKNSTVASSVAVTNVSILAGPASARKTISVVATAYSDNGYTSNGMQTTRNPGGYSTIAVDPSVIPINSKVYVQGYGYAIAADTGSAIRGDRIDLYFPTNTECENWGARTVTVTIIG
ncbi:3D domain-containing protein [Clostridium hydrogenum]|uniref:3D domain-containing protein n=1 Tax=Clostridium hydrogenum TaxID=2855764 RepID=UPI002E2F5209|nr:3D domain-containing protein [Clostridium hydrogenum]